jgi:hypothetical protein
MKYVTLAASLFIVSCGSSTDDMDASQGSPDAHAEAATSGDGAKEADASSLEEAGTDGSIDAPAEAEAGGCGSYPTCTGMDGTCCAGLCVDTSSDLHNCGSCGTTCTGGSCDAGSCAACTDDIGTCPHSPCETGSALTMLCDLENVTIYVCSMNHACCSTGWTSACVTIAKMYVAGMCSDCL